MYMSYMYIHILLNLFTTQNMLLSSLGLLLSSGCASKLFVLLLSLFCKLNKNTLKANLHDQLLHHHYLPSTPAVLVSCNLCESEKNNKLSQLYPIIKGVHIWRGEKSNAVCCNNIWTWLWTPICCDKTLMLFNFSCGTWLRLRVTGKIPCVSIH